MRDKPVNKKAQAGEIKDFIHNMSDKAWMGQR
jgi:hypothetical protein